MIKADVAECLATPERSHFFGKRDLTFGINLLQRREIWKTFLAASRGPSSASVSLDPVRIVPRSSTRTPDFRSLIESGN
jgi:hypothetical protein